ncbi:MAG TPA: cupin domain-containing protein [Pseudonocardia sp.]|jgi:quercetin dioxygenase-like cupin family protein|nr:cupin domain-containing protein [Pseudonocardia sp.]
MTDTDPTTARRPMSRATRGRIALVAALMAAGLLALGALTGFVGNAGAGQGEHGHGEITTTPIGPRSAFTDDVDARIRFRFDGKGRQVVNVDDASRITTLAITIPPGGVFPWHTHPGPVLINVAEGEFVYRLAADCVDREYGPGEALIDAGGDNVHTAYNPGTGPTRVIATILGAPADGPLTVPAPGPDPAVCPLPTP